MKDLNVNEIQAVSGGLGFFAGVIAGAIALDAYHDGITKNGLNFCVSIGQSIIAKCSEYFSNSPAQVQNEATS